MLSVPWHLFTYENTPEFSMNGQECVGRVVNIHDGDTLTIVLPVFTSFFRFSVRLAGIDTCETTSKNPENMKLATDACLRLFSLVTNDVVTSVKEIKPFLRHNICLVHVNCLDFDKYGRLLADVSKSKDTVPFSKILVDEKLAYVYDGGKKLTETEQLKLFRE